MHPRLSIQKRLLLIGFVIIGIAAGIIFVSPKVDGDKFLGGSVGFISAWLLIFLLIPEFRYLAGTIWNGDNKYGFNMKNYFSHPTQKPLMLGMLWFLIFMAILSLFHSALDRFQVQDKPYFLFAFLFPSLALFGLSGFLMIKRNEGVNRFGQIYKGFWAYMNGILGILFGWGGLILLILAEVFNW